MKKILSVILFSSLAWNSLLAQCAMCKASAETSLESSQQAAGINTGVLYVLVFVFFSLCFFGYLFYKGVKNADAN